ncbi:hypothetical protein [Vibrio sp. VPAP30]|uniref:hypothetical protein n=1 Tax=Vibrio sp. VPAP30 TaxID=1647102 RepID=UPI000657D8CD|nr:hypothetical protein [Vibrio sp. VPAP30]KLN66059.1 hypothetical protein ZX61_06665 [Vibrio sp. VPAP30]
MHSELDDQRVLQTCLAHLTAAMNTSKHMTDITGDPTLHTSLLSPLLILSSDLLTGSKRYHAIGSDMATFAMAYSVRTADWQCWEKDTLSELTTQLEHYIERIMKNHKLPHSVTPSRSVQ